MASGTLKGITIEIGGETTELTKALSDVGGRAREAGSELRAVENALKFNPGNVELLAQREKYASEQAAALRERLDLVNRALSSGQVERGSKAYDRLRRELITTADRIEKLDAKAGEARRALADMGDGGEEAARGIGRVGDAVRDALGDFDALESAASGAMYAMGEDAVDAARSAASSVVESAASWDAATARMEAAVGGVAEEAERLEGVGRGLYSDGWGDSLGQLTDSVVSAREVLGELSEEDLSAVTEAALGLEEVFGSDVSETLRGVNVLMERFGLTATEASDLMVAGAQRGLDYTDELGDNVAEYAGRWADAGLSASGYFSLLQAGVDAGAYSLDRVGDYLNEFLTSLSDGRMEESVGSFSAETRALWESYKAGGATARQMLDAVIGELRDCQGETERAALASELWGTLGEDNAMSVILALGDVEDSYGDVAGSAEGLADTVEDTFDKRMAASVRGLQEAFEPLALAGMEALTGLLEGAQPAVEAFASLDAGTQALVVSMVAIAPAASKAVRALRAFEGTSKVIGGVSKALGGVSAGIAGLGLAALVGVVGMVADEIGKANEAAEEAAQRAADLQAVSEGVAGALDGIDASSLSGVAGAASDASGALSGVADDASALAARVQEGCDATGEILADTAQSFRDVAQSLAETDASNAQVESLAATIDRLRDTEGLAEDQQIELESAVRRFNDATGASIEVVDSHNGKLSETPEKIDAICDAYVREAKAQALSQGLTELYDRRLEQESALEESAKSLGEAYLAMWDQMYTPEVVDEFLSVMNSSREEMAGSVADIDGYGQTVTDRFAELYETLGYSTDGMHLFNAQASDTSYLVDQAADSVTAAQTALDSTNGEIADLEGQLHDVVAGAGEGAQSLDDLAGKTGEAGDAAEGAARSLDEMNASLEPALKGMRGSAEGVDDLGAALDGIAESADPVADALDDAERALDDFDKSGGDVSDLARDLNAALRETGDVTVDLTDAQVLYAYQTGMTVDQLHDYAAAQSEAAQAAEEAADAQERAAEEERERVEALVESYADFSGAHAGFSEALAASGTDLESFALSLDAVGISFEDFEASFDSLASAVSPLERLSGETEMYTWKMRDNLVANTEAVRSYSSNVAEMYSRVTNEQQMAFADYVAGLGIEYADFLNYLMWDADVSFEELAQVYSDGMSAAMDGSMDIVDAKAQAMAEMTGQSFEDCKALIEAGAAEATSGVGDAMAEGVDGSGAADKASGEFAEGLLDGRGEATTSADLLGEGAMDALMGLPGEMRARGEAAGGMLAVGIAQGTASIPSGVSSVVDMVASELAPMPGNMGLLGESAGMSLAEGVASGAAPSAEAATSLSASCASALSAFPSDMSVVGTLGGESFADGVSSGESRSRAAAQALATACGSALSAFPSQMHAAGSSGGRAFGDGVQLQMGYAYSSAWNLAGAALSAMSTMTASAYASGAELGGNFAAGIASQVNTAALAASSVAGAVSDRLHFSEPKLGPLVGINDSGAEMVHNFARSMLSEVPALAVASEAAAQAARIAPADPGWSPCSAAAAQRRASEQGTAALTKADVYDAMRAAIRAEVGDGGLSVLMDGRRVGTLLAPHIDRELSAIEARRSR